MPPFENNVAGPKLEKDLLRPLLNPLKHPANLISLSLSSSVYQSLSLPLSHSRLAAGELL